MHIKHHVISSVSLQTIPTACQALIIVLSSLAKLQSFHPNTLSGPIKIHMWIIFWNSLCCIISCRIGFIYLCSWKRVCSIIIVAYKQKEIMENNIRIHKSSENRLLSQNSKYANLRLTKCCYIYMFSETLEKNSNQKCFLTPLFCSENSYSFLLCSFSWNSVLNSSNFIWSCLVQKAPN